MHLQSRCLSKWVYNLTRKTTSFAMFWAILWMPSSCNRAVLYVSSAGYHQVSFQVTNAAYNASSDSLVTYWLTGTVGGREERLIPPLESNAEVNSSEDLLKIFPRGKNLPAMYNSSMPDLFLQGESLRLRYDNGKFWESEVQGGSWLLKLAFFPILPAIILNTFVRCYKRPEDQQKSN